MHDKKAEIRIAIDSVYSKTSRTIGLLMGISNSAYEMNDLRHSLPGAPDWEEHLKDRRKIVRKVRKFADVASTVFAEAQKANQKISDLFQFSYPQLGAFRMHGGGAVTQAIAYLDGVVPECITWAGDFCTAYDGTVIPSNDEGRIERFSKILGRPPLTVRDVLDFFHRQYLEQGQLYRDHVGPELMTLREQKESSIEDSGALWLSMDSPMGVAEPDGIITTRPNLKQQRNNWLLDTYQSGNPTYGELLEHLTIIAPSRKWDLLETPSSIGSALREAYLRRHDEPWPYDKRGKSKKRKNES